MLSKGHSLFIVVPKEIVFLLIQKIIKFFILRSYPTHNSCFIQHGGPFI